MSYQVLARKYRPGIFAELVGQDHVVRALTHALDNDRLHHAYLFTGTRGVGKTTIARILAKSLNCEKGVSSTPCGECSICLEVAENRFIDLIEVDAASRTRVDDTRELLENAQYLPTRGRFKVYLIDEVHMLSASSFNALLKTLEEPPGHVKFLLATTDPKKVPVTVLSRCLQFQLKNISAERTQGYLGEILDSEGIEHDASALEVIGKAARGSMRDALSITDQAIGFGQGALREADVIEMLGLVGRDEVGALLDALASGNADRVLKVVAELADRAADFEALLAELLAAFHDMAVQHAVGSGDAQPFDAENVQLLYQIGLLGFRDLGIAPDPRSGVEMTLLRMLAFAPDEAGSRVAPIPDTEEPEKTSGPAAEAKAAPEAESGTIDTSERRPGLPSDGGPVATEAVDEEGVESERVETESPDPQVDRSVVGEQKTWHDLVSRLDLGGVARMIAEHSILDSISDEQVRLILDQAHDTLLGDSQLKTIERALTDTLGRELKLSIETGGFDTETPAGRRQRVAAERQRRAEELLESDSAVQSLLSEFGGRLDGVQALEAHSVQATTGGVNK